jgi:hypothetical protein
MKKLNEAKWSITKRNEIYQAKHKRSKNNRWRGKNQQNIEWLVRLFIDLSLDAFLLQNSKRSTKVMHQYSKYILNSLKHRVSFRRRPVSFRCISFCFFIFRFVLWFFISFRFFNVRFVSLYFVSVCDTSFRFVSSFFVSFRCISFRFVSFSFLSLVVLVFPLSYTNFVKKRFFYN